MGRKLERVLKRGRRTRPSAEFDRRMEQLMGEPPPTRWHVRLVAVSLGLSIAVLALVVGESSNKPQVATLRPRVDIVVSPEALPKALWGPERVTVSQWDNWTVELRVDETQGER